MLRERIIFTALPNGVVPNKLRLSVFVSPRLEADPGDPPATIGSYPHLANWPATVAGLSFNVEVGGVSLPAVQIGPARRPDLWQALFGTSGGGGGGPVAPHAPKDLSNTKIRSFPVRDIHSFVRDQYVGLALSSPDDHPDYNALGYDTGDGVQPSTGLSLLGYDVDPHSFAQKMAMIDALEEDLDYGGYVLPDEENGYGGGDTPPVGSSKPPKKALILSELFHNRYAIPGAIPPPTEVDELPPMTPPALDFHQVVGAIGEYPQLLRLLGLVVDLEVTSPLGAGPITATTVKVVPSGFAPSPQVTLVTKSTLTNAAIGQGGFLIATTDPQLVVANANNQQGFYLGLEDKGEKGFDVVDADVDSLTLKLLDYGNNLQRSLEQRSLDTPAKHPPPSARSAGLSVVRRARSQLMRNAIDHQVDFEAALGSDSLDSKPIQAEHVVRGYRVDVWDDTTQRWRTICARRGTYQFPGGATVQLDDEGAITIGATKGLPGKEEDLFLHESLFRWSGWSAVAPRPGKAIDKNDENGLTVPDNPPDPNFPMKVSFVPLPGSLPKLRYGTSYRFRVRPVDLAGNSLPLVPTSTDFTGASEALRYGRFDPVQTPFVLPRKPLTPGESSETMVLRSNFNVPPFGARSERHIAPAKIAELMAEEHGLFDAGGRPNKAAYGFIANTEAQSFATMGTVDPNTPAPNALSSGFRYYDVDHQPVPFIPDPLAKGGTMRGLPGVATGEPFMVTFGPPPPPGLLDPILGPKPLPKAPYPNGYSFRIVMAEGTAGPYFDPKRKVLTVFLPKATVADVKLSSYLADADLKALGLWRWIEELAGSGAVAELRASATKGELWQLTPFRTIRMVHAVQQPLFAPRFTKPAAVRDLGDTFATILDTMGFSRKSTATVDVKAEWNEFVDKPEETPPAPPALPRDPSVPIPASATPFTLTTQREHSDGDALIISHRHEFNDTRHRFVKYSAIGTSRFVEYFAKNKDVTIGSGETLIDALGFVPASVVVRTLDGTKTFVNGPTADYTTNDATGKIARGTNSSLPATPVRVTYVAPPVTRASTEVQQPVLVDVPSSARPLPPKVKYIVPTFAWSVSGNTAGKTSTRQGNGLRVYLDRPWWSSGEREQLAAVLWRRPPGQNDPPGRLANLVTQLALDPIWVTGAATENPTAAAFPLAVVPASDLSLPELPAGPHVDVAPHNVGYDPARQLWYCDIVINPGKTYTPFVRLALARYQLHSVPEAHLSSVVTAEFAQLTPDRSASVAFVPGSTTKVNVGLTGLSHGGTKKVDNSLRSGPNEASVMVQVKQPGVTGELAWIDSPAFTQPQPLAAVANPDGTTTWSAQITLPAARGSQPFRLLFREYEVHNFDKTGYAAADPRFVDEARRLVYVDTLEI